MAAAAIQIGSIGPFNPKDESIEAYIARLTVWMRANKVKNNDKADAALSVIGPAAFTVLLNTCHPDDPSTKSFEDLTGMLTKHYHAPRNKYLERKVFREREQRGNESVSDFALALKQLSMSCEFGDTLNDNLIERFSAGVRSTAIQNKLYSIKKLTWENAQAEAVSMEQNRSDKGDATGDVHQVRRGGNRRGGFTRGRGFGTRTSGNDYRSEDPCERCLSAEHASTECPYKRATCYNCNRKGHVKSACRNQQSKRPQQTSSGARSSGRGKANRGRSGRSVNQVETEESTSGDFANLYHIQAINSTEKSDFDVTITVDGVAVTFAVDTQAAVSVISENLYHAKFGHCKMEPVKYALRSYSGHEIPVLGQIPVTVGYQGQSADVSLVVVKGTKESLLGRDWLKIIKLDWKQLFQTVPVQKSDSVDDVVNRYSDVFCRSGVIRKFEARVRVKQDAQPVFRKARPVPYSLREAVEKNLEKAVKEGILTPVKTSQWASPIVVAPKADGNIRVCGDYKRTVNMHLDDEVYPLPTAQDIFSTLAGGQIFSTIDLSNAYQQVMLTTESKELLTINTHKGLFQYNRLPYGIKVAPAMFQAIMDQILSGLNGVCCYLDDILLTSKTRAEHAVLLEKVLTRLQEYGVLANKTKCRFGIEEVNYLGHVIDKEGIRPSPEKVRALQAVKEPKNVAELRTFLGAVTFYHKFLRDFATVCTPLYALTKKEAKWVWSVQCRKAFLAVKEMLTGDLLLTHYDVKLPLKLSTDASPHGVAAILAHVIDGFERPIAYASRTLSPAERNYSQLEREALAIMFGVKRFHKYVYGRKFVLVTDNKPLSIIFNPTKDIPTVSALRLQRWALVLMAHDYTIEYRKAADHGNVDMLSRFPDETVSETLEMPMYHFSYVDDLPVTSADVRKETAGDPNLKNVLRYVMFGWPEQVEEPLTPYFRRRNELSVEQGCLLWGMRVIIPKSLQARVLQDVHHEHTGVVRMKMLARSYYWFPSLDQELENLARACESCRMHAQAPAAAPTVSWPKCTNPWERVHIDFGTIDNKELLILVDVFSKWIEVAVMNTTTSQRVIEVLRNWWARFGIPVELVSDNGPQFTSSEFEDFLRRNGVKHTLTPPYSPKTNGSAEKTVQVVKGILKKQFTDEYLNSKVHRSFQQKLDDFLITYRSTPSTATGLTPSEMILGRKLRTRLSFLRPEGKTEVKEVFEKGIREFQAGDLVWVRNVVGRKKWSPGQVVRREGVLKYYVDVDGRQRLVHVDHLAKRVQDKDTVECVDSQVNPDQGVMVPVNDSVPSDVTNMPIVPNPVPNQAIVPNQLPNQVIVPNRVHDEIEVQEPEPRRSTRDTKAPQRLIEHC